MYMPPTPIFKLVPIKAGSAIVTKQLHIDPTSHPTRRNVLLLFVREDDVYLIFFFSESSKESAGFS